MADQSLVALLKFLEEREPTPFIVGPNRNIPGQRGKDSRVRVEILVSGWQLTGELIAPEDWSKRMSSIIAEPTNRRVDEIEGQLRPSGTTDALHLDNILVAGSDGRHFEKDAPMRIPVEIVVGFSVLGMTPVQEG